MKRNIQFTFKTLYAFEMHKHKTRFLDLKKYHQRTLLAKNSQKMNKILISPQVVHT